MKYTRSADTTSKWKNDYIIKTFKTLSEDAGGPIETSVLYDKDGREVANIVKKDGKLHQSSATTDAQDSGLYADFAKKLSIKESDLKFTKASAVTAQMAVEHDKNDGNKLEKGDVIDINKKKPVDKPVESDRDKHLKAFARALAGLPPRKEDKLEKATLDYSQINKIETEPEDKAPSLNYKDFNSPEKNPAWKKKLPINTRISSRDSRKKMQTALDEISDRQESKDLKKSDDNRSEGLYPLLIQHHKLQNDPNTTPEQFAEHKAKVSKAISKISKLTDDLGNVGKDLKKNELMGYDMSGNTLGTGIGSAASSDMNPMQNLAMSLKKKCEYLEKGDVIDFPGKKKDDDLEDLIDYPEDHDSPENQEKRRRTYVPPKSNRSSADKIRAALDKQGKAGSPYAEQRPATGMPRQKVDRDLSGKIREEYDRLKEKRSPVEKKTRLSNSLGQINRLMAAMKEMEKEKNETEKSMNRTAILSD